MKKLSLKSRMRYKSWARNVGRQNKPATGKKRMLSATSFSHEDRSETARQKVRALFGRALDDDALGSETAAPYLRGVGSICGQKLFFFIQISSKIFQLIFVNCFSLVFCKFVENFIKSPIIIIIWLELDVVMLF